MIKHLPKFVNMGKIPARQIFPTTKKSAFADLVNQIGSLNGWPDTLMESLTDNDEIVKIQNMGMDSPGVEPGRLGVSSQPNEPVEPMPCLV